MSIIVTQDQREAGFVVVQDTENIYILDVFITWFQAKKTARIDVNDKFTFCKHVHVYVYGTLS